MIRGSIGLVIALLVLATPALGDVIDFTGGTVNFQGGGTTTTNNGTYYQDVDYYTEDGYKLDFIPDATSPFAAIVGDYYNTNDDVIHAHWDTGDYGEVTMIKVTRTDGDSFDLNYFILTSNTDTGGGQDSGNEEVYIHASTDGTTSSYSQLLPTQGWGTLDGFTQIFLGSQFDNIKAFWFTANNSVDCFGMDEFYINEAAPPPVPEPLTLSLFAMGLGGLAAARRRRRCA